MCEKILSLMFRLGKITRDPNNIIQTHQQNENLDTILYGTM